MSLRCVGNQLLQSAPSSLLVGASTASASLWVQVNPANNVVATNGVEIFGDSGGKFSAILTGTGGLQLQWSSNTGKTTSVSTCSLALTPGTSYHLAATWQAGTQVYYLNGVQVQADSKSGTLGTPGNATAQPFRLGSDQAGTDVTLDQPTLWVGYALTAQDVVNLRNRTVQPAGIAPASIALEWSLAGTAGASAKVGDAGLADASPNALNLSTIVGAAPTYLAGDLTYVPTPTIGRATVAPSGKAIVLFPEDAKGAITNVASIRPPSEIQSIRLTSTPANNAFTISFGGKTTAPIPTTTSPPYNYFLWTFPTIAGHTYSLAVNDAIAGSPGDYNYFYETIDSGVVVATHLRPGVPSSAQFSDPGVNVPGGNPALWEPVSSGVVAKSTTLEVRYSSSAGLMFMSALRVQDTTAGTITYFTATETANITTMPVGWSYSANNGTYGGFQYYNYGGSGIGPLVGISPGNSTATAMLQSALEALPSVGNGGVVVTDLSGTGSGNYQITFTGPLANASQPLLSCTDPALTIAEVNGGGVFPSLTIDGGATIPLSGWIWGDAVPMPYILCPLPQSAPASQTFVAGQLPYISQGSWYTTPDDSSLSGQPIFDWLSGERALFEFEELPPATYQIAITYPITAFDRFTPWSATQFQVQDGSGNILGNFTVDQTQTPSDYQSQGVGWKILGSFTTTGLQSGLTFIIKADGIPSVAGPTPQNRQSVAVLDAVQLVRTSPDTSVVIGPNDVASLNIPATWLTTAAGPVPAMANIALAPPSPTAILPPFVVEPKTLKAGYNIEPVSYASNFVTHSNLRMMTQPMGSVQDANGNPTRFVSQGGPPGTCVQAIIAVGGVVSCGDPVQGTYIINPGLYCVTWNGATAVSLTNSGANSTTITDVTASHPAPAGASSNWKVYNVQFDQHWTARPSLWIQLQSTKQDPADPSGNTYIVDLSDLEIYPPDPADPTGNTIWGLNVAAKTWASPPKFHPWFLYKLQGMQSFRTMDILNTNLNPAGFFSDYKSEAHWNRSNAVGRMVKVLTIQPPTNNPFPNYSGSLFMHATTDGPHGLFSGCYLNFIGCGTAEYAGGSLILDTQTTGCSAFAYVLDATNLLIICSNGIGAALTNSMTGGSLNAVFAGPPWPLQDVTDLAAAIGITDLHFNTPATIDVTPGGGAYQVAQFLAENLPTGVKVHAEFGNECWNNAFLTNYWSSLQNSLITGVNDGSYQKFFAIQTKAMHDQFAAAFSAAGRPGDLVRLYGAFAGSPGNTDIILAEAQSIGAVVDEICVAVYYNSWPVQGNGYDANQLPIFNMMTPDQILDYFELNAVYGGYSDDYLTNQVPVLQKYGYGNAKLVAYEGSPSVLVPVDPPGSPPGNTPNFFAKQNAVRRHPRMFGIVLQFAQEFQDNGLTLWNFFNLGGGTGPYTWDTYESGNQQRGTGNPVADAINLTNPLAKNQALCEVGGGWYYWATLVGQTVTTIKKEPIGLGRNGRLRAIGYPHGTFRPTRSH